MTDLHNFPDDGGGNGDRQPDERGVFKPLVGHSGAKAILRSSLRRGDVHILLSGAPGSGKSVALLAIEGAIEGAQYVDARGLSERKLRDILKENPPVLLIDEFDNMKPDPYTALNTSLEQGRVTKNVTGDAYDVEIDTQVFAACNHIDSIPGDVQDRFVHVEFEPYTRDEYVEVCEILLPEQVEWIAELDDPREAAAEIARLVWDETDTRSPRTARDAARLADAVERVPAIVTAMNDPQADVDSEPVYVDELPHHEWREDDENSTRKPTSLEEVRERIADPDNLESRSVSEIQAIIDSAKDGEQDDDQERGEEQGQTDANESVPEPEPEDDVATTSDEPTPGTGDDAVAGDEDEAGFGTDTGFDSGMDYIQQMIASENRVLPNNFEQAGVSIIFPAEYTDEIYALVDHWDINPAGPDVLAQDPLILKEELPENVVEDLNEIQFVVDDPQNIDTAGYDLNQITQVLEDEPVIVSVSPAVQWTPPW